jgi:hypothetical protein
MFPAEHLLDLAGLDLARQGLESFSQLGQRPRIALLGPFDEHRQIVAPAAQRCDQLAVFFEPPPPLQELLRLFLILPEIRLGNARFDQAQLLFRPRRFKDSSADRLPVSRDPDNAASVHRVRWPKVSP